MILLNNFFKIISVEQTENKYSAKVELNPAHEIFKGHFPGNPVVPGVCMVQMLKEILEHIFKKTFTMKEASQLKFLNILNPQNVQSLNVNFGIIEAENSALIASGTFQKDELVYFKFKALYSETQFD